MGSPGTASSSLEQGDISFLYRPRVDRERPTRLDDVQALLMVLRPWDGRDRLRLIVIGRKRLPGVTDGQRFWGYVSDSGDVDDVRDAVERRTYETKTRGERVQPEARPAGEGMYAIVRHRDHTHLAYRLDSPDGPGRLRAELNIAPEASYIISVRNPEAPRPPGVPRRGTGAAFPAALQERFGDRRFVAVDPPSFLDYEGAEVVLIGASGDAATGLDDDLGP